MDINAKKWTDFLWVKATALALSVALFVGFAITVFAWYRQSSQFGETIYYSTDHKAQLSFTDQEEFASEFSLDIEKIVSKTGAYAGESIRQQLLQEYDQNCAAFVAQYNKEKAAFIRTYLFDSLCQEDIYENYEDYFNTDVPLNVPQITIEKRVLVDAYAPAFVRDLQKILNGTDGNGFLRYAALIPDDALAGSVHDGQIQLSKEYFSYGSGFEYTLDLEDPAAYYKSVYEKFIADFDIAQVHRNSVLPASLRYYIFDPKTGTTFTNAECDKQTFLDDFQKQDISFSVLQGKVTQKGLNNVELGQRFNDALNVYVVLDTLNAPSEDKYAIYQTEFENMVQTDMRLMLILAGICVLLSLALLVFLMIFGVHKRLWIDRLPLEVHLLLSLVGAGIILHFGSMIFTEAAGYAFDELGGLLPLMMIAFGALAALGWLIVCEIACSVARTLKSGEGANSSLILRVLKWLLDRLKRLGEMLSYRPGSMRRYVTPLIVCWLLADLALLFLLTVTRSVGLFLLFAVLQCLIAFMMMDYLQQLDKIIHCAVTRREYTGDVSRLPGSLRKLVQSQQYTKEELDRAIEKAITDERTKAELITNVSHDLKTPLTAVINYIDLLGRCDLEDEAAKEYVSVLADKSDRLKRLIEDLIEASKVSTGNVNLTKTPLSLSELANQAVVEETDGMETADLELVFTTHASPTVLADGGKIYRVFENLLSNARKYSLPGTRVYATVYEEEKWGCFELKNISREALDIPPEELTDRFVRGDRSRSEEGNGLGLSIAKDLCKLNGGELILSIDGDLFKATVRLPKC